MVNDNIGKVYGKYTILGSKGKGPDLLYLVKCACQIKKYLPLDGIKVNKFGCKKCTQKIFSINTNPLPPGMAAFNCLFGKYKNTNRPTKIKFLLSPEQFREITSKNCHYCDAPPSYSALKGMKNRAGSGDYIYNGIDRKVNSEDYILSNCLPCCKVCNFLKGSLAYDVFLQQINLIFKNFYN